jgi:hypothetical protein
MNAKVQLSKKTKSYLLRVILTGVFSLIIGMASTGQMIQASAEGLAQTGTGSPLVGDVRIAPDLKPVSAQAASGSSAPGYYDTSVFMTGSVTVGVILPESNGGTENWTPTKVNNVKTQIQNGMNLWSGWYTQYSGIGNLSFTYEWHTPYDGTDSVAVSNEPISTSSQQDYVWENEILGRWGYTQSYTQSSDPNVNGFYTAYLRNLAYANDLRTQHGTDWAFTIFVVDSENDADGMFTDGYFAYSVLYGPMLVMTYDNDGWGIDQMYKVAAHETGHIFGAGDQYYQAGYGGCTSKTQKYGYLGIPNSNCDYLSATGVPSLMKSNSLVLDATARYQVGWRDSDSDGVFDPLDTPPNFKLSNYAPDPTTNANLAYSGTSYIQPWPHAVCGASDRCYDQDVTTQKLTVDYSVDSGAWQSASATDGSFNSDYESFNFVTETLSNGSHNIDVRSQASQGNVVSTWTDTVTVQRPTSPVADVDTFPGKNIQDTDIPFTDTVDTTSATSDTNGVLDPPSIVLGDCDSNKGDASVWYYYTPGTNISLYVDTIGSSYDTVLAIWEGAPGNLTLVSCNDDISLNDLQSKVGFYAQVGRTYYIEVIEYVQPAQSQAGETRTLNFHMEEGFFSSVDVFIGGVKKGSYAIPLKESLRVSYDVNDGPAQITSTNNTPIIAAMRVIWQEPGQRTSYSELMGVPKEQLSTEYWFPWYNNMATKAMDQQFRFGNADSSATTVEVYLGSTLLGSYPLAPGESTRVSYAVNNGPIRIRSTDNRKIIAAMRVIWQEPGQRTSYSELMGLPKEQLSSEYWFPWYNNLATKAMDQQFRFGNADSTPTTVEVYAGSTLLGSYPLDPGESVRESYAVNNGPIRVVSTDNKKIIAAMRSIWQEPGQRTSYSELMGLPKEQLSSEYLFPWYNNLAVNAMDQQFRFGNADSSATTVEVYVGSTLLGSYPLNPGESVRESYAINNGPIRVVSTDNKKIIAAMRAIWQEPGQRTSYSELMGLPKEQLSTEYWFPWYNNLAVNAMDQQFRFGVP